MDFRFHRTTRTVLLCALMASTAACSGHRTAAVPPLQMQSAAAVAKAAIRAPRSVALANDAAAIPSHIKTYGYWGQPYEPGGISASYVAQHMTFLSGDASHITAFKAAGGTYGVSYVDPNHVITQGPTLDPMSSAPEGAWFHDASGNRVYKPYGSYGTQNVINPTVSSAQTLFAQTVSTLAASAPFDYIEVDDVSFDLLNVFYNFSASGSEVTSNSTYQAGEIAMLGLSSLPVLLNGANNHDGGSSVAGVTGDVVYLPAVAGLMDNEGCMNSINDATYPVADWQNDENTMLYTIAQKKVALCWGESSIGPDARVPRLFFLASFWLTYDPTYSVAFPGFASNGGYFYVFPEYDIVPTQPLVTATSNVSQLLDGGGAYIREFAACYQAGKPIGACATVVNPSPSNSVAMPAAAAKYTTALTLDSYNQYSGGKATWSSMNVPATLGPHGAMVLSGATIATPAPTPPPTPVPTPTSTPAPTATPVAQLTLSGTVSSVVSSTEFVMAGTSCGYEPIFYNSGTAITANGGSISAGTALSITGVGNCSTSVTASAITIAPKATPTPSATPSPAPTPTPFVSNLVTQSGMVWSASANSVLMLALDPCGYVNVSYGSGTSITANGQTLAPGTPITLTGTGSCSTQFTAASITLGGSNMIKQKGVIASTAAGKFLLNAPDPCGYVYVNYGSNTLMMQNGLAIKSGTYATVWATGSCSSQLTASTITLSSS